jgi:murein DD-endopeptidase MepM/ murein hydrolase activator NlpD
MAFNQQFEDVIKFYTGGIHPVVPFNPAKDKLVLFDFSRNNKELPADITGNTDLFSEYVDKKLEEADASYGIGGYNEMRNFYDRSEVFNDDGTGEPRRLHLGMDIWGSAGTTVYAPLEATVHSFAFNDNYGDYGATLILQHELEGVIFHTLYGHLSLHSIQDKREGDTIEKGSWIAAFGEAHENGNWPPHLHFQIILNMQGLKGDYPGVCKLSEREKYLANSPDPDLILRMLRFV